MSKKLLLAASAVAVFASLPAFAADEVNLQSLQAEIQAMRDVYENKIQELQQKVDTLSAQQTQTAADVAAVEATTPGIVSGSNLGSFPANKQPPATARRRVSDSSFNPEIGVLVQGAYQSFSDGDGDMAGFAIGEEGERGEEGLSIDETEVNFAANIDNVFRGSATFALHEHDGEVEIEMEEAFVETMSLPYGLSVKGGRFFSELGYMNSHHQHSDDFADRPLPNRAFLDSNYGDDGVQVTALLPTDFYAELGGGVFRGADFPSGGAEGNEIGAWTAYGRLGGDIGQNASWRLGLSTLQTDEANREANDDTVTFEGESGLYIADARMTYAPTGNPRNEELILQGEYFFRDEDGTYEDTDAGTGAVNYDDSQSGFYLQGVYKFHPQWRAGVRYSQLFAGDTAAGLQGSALDSEGHDPWAAAAMVDWSNSEFSRVRAQFNREELSDGVEDNQFILQYIMSLGAHGAHPF